MRVARREGSSCQLSVVSTFTQFLLLTIPQACPVDRSAFHYTRDPDTAPLRPWLAQQIVWLPDTNVSDAH